MAKLIGLSNRIMNDMVGALLSSQEVCKLLTVYDDVDILEEEDLNNTYWLFNKHIFINRRVPQLLDKVGAYVTIRMSDCRDRSTSKTKILEEGYIEVYIIIHNSILHTQNGSRDVALVSFIKDILGDENLSTLGKVSIEEVKDIYQLPTDYAGYSISFKYDGYKQVVIND